MPLLPQNLPLTKYGALIVGLLLTVAQPLNAIADNGSLVRTSGFSIGSTSAPTDSQATGEAGFDSTGMASSTNASSLSIPLKGSAIQQPESSRTSSITGLAGSLGTTVGALAVTLGLFALFVAFTRRMQKGHQAKGLPREAFEVIGETEIGPKQKLLVVRCGLQALIVGVSPVGIQPVAQIDDPDEAGQFIAQCRGLGSTTVFSSTLKEMEKESTRPGFIDDSANPRNKGKLFLRA